MYSTVKSTLVFFFLMHIFMHHCLNIIPERAKLTYVNDKFFENASLNVRRYGRRSNYVLNFEITSKVELGNNVTIDIIVYQYLHNEFRRSFVELHFKFCDLIHRDPFLGNVLRNAGLVTCPIPPKHLSIKNLSLDMEIPSRFPFERGMAELIATSDPEQVVMGKLQIVLTFIQKL